MPSVAGFCLLMQIEEEEEQEVVCECDKGDMQQFIIEWLSDSRPAPPSLTLPPSLPSEG